MWITILTITINRFDEEPAWPQQRPEQAEAALIELFCWLRPGEPLSATRNARNRPIEQPV